MKHVVTIYNLDNVLELGTFFLKEEVRKYMDLLDPEWVFRLAYGRDQGEKTYVEFHFTCDDVEAVKFKLLYS